MNSLIEIVKEKIVINFFLNQVKKVYDFLLSTIKRDSFFKLLIYFMKGLFSYFIFLLSFDLNFHPKRSSSYLC